jgi:hypothetical protein
VTQPAETVFTSQAEDDRKAWVTRRRLAPFIPILRKPKPDDFLKAAQCAAFKKSSVVGS